MQPDTAPLLPCPFCQGGKGGLMEIDHALWAVVCTACHAIGPQAPSRVEAQRVWNARNSELETGLSVSL